MNVRNSHKSRAARWVVGLLLLGVVGALCWLSEQPAQASWDVMPMPEEGATCADSDDSSPVPQPLPPGNPAAFSPLTGMSLSQIKAAAQSLTPEEASLLSSVDIQFHNLYPGTTLDGPTAVTSVTIQTSLCIEDMWVQIILPAQSSGGAKFAYALKSPSSVLDRLHDWVRFPFPAISGVATAGVGLDGFAQGVYPFTWVIGFGDTVLMTQDGFFAVGACCCDGCSSAASSQPLHSLPILPSDNLAVSGSSTDMSLDQIKLSSQTLTPEAEQMLSSLDIQFHNLYPSTTLDGPTAVTSVTIRSNLCLEDVWAQIILPAQSTGEAKFARAFKSPSSVWDHLHDWVRFPFPAIGGTAIAGVGLDGFVEGVYPFTWVIGQGDTVLMTRDGSFTVGGCCCAGFPSTLNEAPSVAFDPLAGMSLAQIEQSAQTLTPEAEQMLNSLDIQFHNLYPATTLNGPTQETSVTIQSDLCLEDVWARIILPDQSTGRAKFARAFKSPSSVWDHLRDWVLFPFPAVMGTATAGVGLDGFAEGVYPFSWVVGHGDTILMTQNGFFAVGACCCGIPVTPIQNPSPTPVPAGECIQYSPGRIAVLMGEEQTIYREIEFVNTCPNTLGLDLAFSNLVSQIYLAGGHDQITLSPSERQAVRLYFTTGNTVPSESTELVATAGGVEAARIPLSIGPGATIQPSASLSALNSVNLLLEEVGVFNGRIQNNASISLTITGTVPTALSSWLSVADSNPATDVSVLWRQPRWELGPGDEGEIYFVLHSSEEHTATASFYLESQYGDRQEIPVSARFGPYADLEISGSTMPTQMTPGDAVTVAVTVTNPGPSDAPTVTVPIAVRGDATVTDVTASSGVTCTQETAVVCKTLKLLVGESVTAVVRLEATAVKQASRSELLLLGASLRGEILTRIYDPNSPNNVWVAIWGGSRIYLPLILCNP